MHLDAPTLETVPLSSQSKQLEFVPSPNLPASHEVQPVSEIVVQFEEMSFPTAQVLHKEHDAWPTSAWKLMSAVHGNFTPPTHACPTGQGSSDTRAVGEAMAGVVNLPADAMLTVAECVGQ